MIDYGRNIESFCIPASEKWLVAGNISGQLLTIDIDDFRIVNELDAHAGMIIALDAHPTLPFICALGVDQMASVWEYSPEGQLSLRGQINLRLPKPENDHNLPPSTSVSQAIAFHPTEHRLLARAANGAVVEITFHQDRLAFEWCHAFYPGSETAYVRYLHDPRLIFVTSGNGKAGVFDSKERNHCTLEYRYNHEVIHAAEHIGGSHYLLPSDSRRVIRLDVSGETPPLAGPAIVRDHLERVDYNKKSRRALVSSFDRCIYEVCPDTGRSLGTIARTPMKCRWLKTLHRQPDTLVVQCRNGALYKLDIGQNLVCGVIKETPNALWCGVNRGDSILLAGDGSEVMLLTVDGADRFSRKHIIRPAWVDLGYNPGVYTKRMSLHSPNRVTLFGRTDGKLHAGDEGGVRQLFDLGSPVRDLDTSGDGRHAFAVTEDGVAHCVDLEADCVQRKFHSPKGEPLWALAYNRDREMLAVAEREGSLYLLDAHDLSIRSEILDIRRAKRARWLDKDRLLVVSSTELVEIDVDRGTVGVLVPNQRNTIEDFAWSEDRRYLVLISYSQNIVLFDLASRTLMHATSFDMHYPKGITWIHPADGGYRYEFLVWGRSGIVHHYRVHDGRILHLGAVSQELSQVHKWAGVEMLKS